ncbi:serine protease [Breoghania sp. L-A4]|uniref:S1 family peptidase n=1 Tax=Breoghania sp. L-A4 TaxID=2304600 RepID=UPI0020C00B09|nr:serine protease [Breoghania sp. L-A4]
MYHPSKSSNSFKVKVIKRHEHRDLALLEPHFLRPNIFELVGSGQIIVEDAPTIALGYPGYGPGDKLNIRSGTVSSLPMKSGVQTDRGHAKNRSGMSGGPLLDAHQNVIGINHKGGPDMARDFAVHINELTAWLAE